jgi:hypothetical protein
MAVSEPVLVSFKNNIGQEINPGDPIVIVTTGYGHQVSTCGGTYLGMHKNGRGVQCEKQVKTTYYAFKDSGERVSYKYFQEMNDKLSAWAKEWRQNNPGKYAYYSEPEYKAIREEYMSNVETKSEYVARRTTLQRNRIYKLAA